jgi:hypothetical protein
MWFGRTLTSTDPVDKGDTGQIRFLCPQHKHQVTCSHDQTCLSKFDRHWCSNSYLVLLKVPLGQGSQGGLSFSVGMKELPGTKGSTDNESFLHVPVHYMALISTPNTKHNGHRGTWLAAFGPLSSGVKTVLHLDRTDRTSGADEVIGATWIHDGRHTARWKRQQR